MERALKHCNNLVFDTQDFEQLYFLVAPTRWMLVCDKSFAFLPERIKQLYLKHKDNCVVFDDFDSNPKYESIIKGVDLFSKNTCPLIVAIGGGSTIDVAKCIKLFSGLKEGQLYFKQQPNYDLVSQINLVVA